MVESLKFLCSLLFIVSLSVVRCPFVSSPENGTKTVSGYSNGSIATFTCNPGYEITGGSIKRYCQDDSTWSGSDVVCAIKSKLATTMLRYLRILF